MQKVPQALPKQDRTKLPSPLATSLVALPPAPGLGKPVIIRPQRPPPASRILKPVSLGNIMVLQDRLSCCWCCCWCCFCLNHVDWRGCGGGFALSAAIVLYYNCLIRPPASTNFFVMHCVACSGHVPATILCDALCGLFRPCVRPNFCV